jgi:pilus assembly protein Flp/PilA
MMKMYFDYFRALLGNKKGQGMVEYGLIIGLIAVVLIVALGAMQGQLTVIFNKITSALTGAASSGTTTGS